MNRLKKIILIVSLVVLSPTLLFAGFGLGLGVNFQNQVQNEDGTYTVNPFPLSLVLTPSYETNKFSMEYILPLGVKFENSFGLDTSYYNLPERKTEQSDLDYSLSVVSHYLSFISYIQYGNNFDDFNVRLGKLTNSTLGDGAILNHYRELELKSYTSRPGFSLKLDGDVFNFGLLGAEFITNDMFNPDFYGGRVFVRPLYFMDNTLLSNISLGYSLINNRYTDSTTNKYGYFNDYSLDISETFIKNENYKLNLYYDMINKGNYDKDLNKVTRDISWRLGLNGYYFKNIYYDVNLKAYTAIGSVDNSNFFKDNGAMISNTFYPHFNNGIFEISGETGYYSNSGQSYIVLVNNMDFDNYSLTGYKLGIKAKSFTQILFIKNLSVELYKNYPVDTATNKPEESFFEGLVSNKNIDFSARTDIEYGINVFTVGVNLSIDKNSAVTTAYTFGYKLSLL